MPAALCTQRITISKCFTILPQLQGKAWDLGADTNQWACSNSIITVDSVSTVNIGGISRRVLHTTEALYSTIGPGVWTSPLTGPSELTTQPEQPA